MAHSLPGHAAPGAAAAPRRGAARQRTGVLAPGVALLLLGAAAGPSWLAGRGPQALPRRVQAAAWSQDAAAALDGAVSDKKAKQVRAANSAQKWRRAAPSWPAAPPVLSDGEVQVKNLKHGTNILLLEESEFPPFGEIRPEHVDRGIKWMAMQSGNQLWELYHKVPMFVRPKWETLMHPLETITDKVERVFNTIQFMKDVVDPSPKMLKAWKESVLTRWICLRRMRRSERFLPHFHRLLGDEDHNEAQRRTVASQMLLFEYDGVSLHEGIGHRDDPKAFLHFVSVRKMLFNVTQSWDDNIRSDMTRKAFLVRQAEELEGVPSSVLQDAVAAAKLAGYPKATVKDGPWMISLDEAMTEPILKHAKVRTFREFVYAAKMRVAFLGGSGRDDNTANLINLLKLRLRYANLLGYPTYADLAMRMRMASLKQAFGFLARLRRVARPVAMAELQEVQEFADSQGADYNLDHFDVPYWQERLKQSKFSLSDDFIREYLPVSSVFGGLFGLLKRLFGVDVVEEEGAEVYDKHVRLYRLRDSESGELLGSMFLDAYRRRGTKKPGFWVQKIQGYSTALGTERHGPRRPAVHVICDLPPPGDGSEVLLSMDQVAKVFHTVGASLRELLSDQDEGLVSGDSGVELDARSLPGHFLERWAYEPSVLRAISRHVRTGDALPEPAIQTIASARTFHSGMRTLRRSGLAQIDLDLHSGYDPDGQMGVYDVAKIIEAEFSVIEPRVEDHELTSMPLNTDHACGLYADLWSEALAADAFARFEEVLRPDGEEAGAEAEDAVAQLGRRFRSAILAPGGGVSPASAFREFLGRSPTFVAYLGHVGLPEGVDASALDPARPASDGVYDQYEEVYEEDDDYVEYEDLEADLDGYDEYPDPEADGAEGEESPR